MRVIFSNIQAQLINEILIAKEDIKVAVAWFNNSKIFDSLLKRIGQVNISLLISNDRNNYLNGLDFQRFIDSGGVLYLPNDKKLMHNKFLIRDNKVVLTGSYNFTFGAEISNNENIVIIDDESVVSSFVSEYKRLIINADNVGEFEKCINKDAFLIESVILGENIEESSLKVVILSEEDGEGSEIVSLYEEDTMMAYKMIDFYNSGNRLIGRSMINSIVDRLKSTTNRKLLYATSIILYANNETELADYYLSRTSISKATRNFAIACAMYGTKVNFK